MLQVMRMDYRHEIDGLRALAVLAIFGFHFCPDVFPHGYLGVDLFFVVSGFLISLYILEETKMNSFSFLHFYARRAKRILPITLSMLAVTTIFAFAILIGSDLERFLKSLIATVTFTANIFFWRDGGYFGTNDALKPLLHMWSLGVEEQFYLVFPLLLVLMLRLLKTAVWQIITVTVCVLLSFAGNYYLIHAGGATPAFFLTPFRGWELGMGSLAALTYHHRPAQHSSYALAFWIALLVLGLTIVPNRPAPGFLIAVATALFLSRRYIAVWGLSWFFESGVVQRIGVMSFSLYLWHWPVLVFLKYMAVDPPSPLSVGVAVGVTGLLSLLSYRLIEEPFRRTIALPVTLRFASLMTCMLLLVAIATLALDLANNEGDTADTISRSIQTNYRCDVSEYIQYGGSRACLINKDVDGPYEVALIGNSHAQMYVPSVESALRSKGQRGLLIPLNRCLPTIDVNISYECLKLARANYEAFMSDENVKTVIISLTWDLTEWVNENRQVIKDHQRTLISASLLDLTRKIRATGRDVYLVGPIQVPGYDLPSVLSRKVKFNRVSSAQVASSLRVPRADFDAKFKDLLAIFSEHLGERLIRPSEELCDETYCYFGDSSGVYFSDGSHLSNLGAAKVKSRFEFLGRR